ncbi:MAG: Ig-like domain-containing protein [Thermoanaerobaculum sp.]
MKPPFACPLALVLAVQLSGCLSVRTRSEKGPQAEAAVAVVLFSDDAGRKAGRTGPEGVLSELERREHGRWQPVFRSLAARWAVTGLPPGTYRLRFPARLDERGNVVPLSDKPKKLRLAAGDSVRVEAVLEHVPVALVVAGVVVVAVVAVAFSKWLKDTDLPEPPLPPPELVDMVFHLTLDLAAEPWPEAADRAAPMVTSHFPAAGAQVPASPVKLVFVFSEPLAATSLDPQKIRVLGERSGLVPGVASYDARRWWVVWESQKALRGEKVFVTLDAGAVEDLAGNELEKPTSFAFQVR